ncbi:MAG TPA: uroporphyrinogen-III synthase [Chitinophagaceae bacterium]|nr:uroporphyrinogen-III synthase [Chitinophagaceae bacterium]
MLQNNITILSTRPLAPAVINNAAANGIRVQQRSFIETEPIQNTALQQEVESVLQQYATVVFTSMNAVEAVAAYLQDEQPDWRIYCMGKTTRELVTKYFGENSIAGTASDAAALAEVIALDADNEEVVFFCGDQRRDELPAILQQQGIEVTEITVYHTIATPQVVDKNYHGVLFYSPSAVESFFSVNKPAANTTFFAIGQTTANAIKKHSSNTIITANRPGKEALVEKAINYFVHNER